MVLLLFSVLCFLLLLLATGVVEHYYYIRRRRMCRRDLSVPCHMRYVGGTEEHARCARHTNSTKHYDLKGNISPDFSIDTFSNMQRLIVDVEQARKLKNTQTLGTQDPYVKLTLGRTMQKTRVHEDGGN